MSLRQEWAFDQTFVRAALTLVPTTTRGNVTVTTVFRVVDDARRVREQRMTTHRADQGAPPPP